MSHWYSASLAVALIAIAFSNAALYLFQSGIVAQPPFWWLTILGALVVPLSIRYARSLLVPIAPLFGWLVFYFVITISWFAAFPETLESREALLGRFQSMGYVCLVWLLVQQPGALAVMRWSIFAATLFACAVNLFEFFHPGAFSLTTGRAAGLYLNPNISGAALMFGMLVSIGLLTALWRTVFMFVVGLGILVTFSRAALAGWAIVAASLAMGDLRILGARRLAVMLTLVATVAAVVVSIVLLNLGPEQTAALGNVMTDRLGSFMSEDAHDDVSTSERRVLLALVLGQIGQHPWFGSGLGTNRFLDRETGSHNQYLDLIVQQGVVGLFVLPLLSLALAYGSRGPERGNAVRFAFLLMLWGLFSHNVLDERYLLTAVVVQAAISRNSHLSRARSP